MDKIDKILKEMEEAHLFKKDYKKDYKHTNLYLYCMYQFLMTNRDFRLEHKDDVYMKLTNFTKEINGADYDYDRFYEPRVLNASFPKYYDKTIGEIFNFAYLNKDKTVDEILSLVKVLYNEKCARTRNHKFVNYKIVSLKLLLRYKLNPEDRDILEKIIERIELSDNEFINSFSKIFRKTEDENDYNYDLLDDSIETIVEDNIDRMVLKELNIVTIRNYVSLDEYKLALITDIGFSELADKFYKKLFVRVSPKQMTRYLECKIKPYSILDIFYANQQNILKDMETYHLPKEFFLDRLYGVKSKIKYNINIFNDIINWYNNDVYAKDFIPLEGFLDHDYVHKYRMKFFVEALKLNLSKEYYYSEKYECIISRNIKEKDVEEVFIKSFPDKFSSYMFSEYIYGEKLNKILLKYYDEESVEEGDFIYDYIYTLKK